jgi:transcriptional regulator of met regulon
VADMVQEEEAAGAQMVAQMVKAQREVLVARPLRITAILTHCQIAAQFTGLRHDENNHLHLARKSF